MSVNLLVNTMCLIGRQLHFWPCAQPLKDVKTVT